MLDGAMSCFVSRSSKLTMASLVPRAPARPPHHPTTHPPRGAVPQALLLTEHLLKNSGQHVVQTILDASGVIEGLKQFKYLDEMNKDHGINVGAATRRRPPAQIPYTPRGAGLGSCAAWHTWPTTCATPARGRQRGGHWKQ